jgi:hypothetical protein
MEMKKLLRSGPVGCEIAKRYNVDEVSDRVVDLNLNSIRNKSSLKCPC